MDLPNPVPERFVTIDPGGTDLAWAEWRGGRLWLCGLSRTKAAGWMARARAHRSWLLWHISDHCPIVTECMRVRGGRGKGNPQVLVELNGIAGHVGTHWLEPHQWKGMMPKEEHQPLIMAALDDDERAMVMDVKPAGKRHNVIDAVGIGLFVLGRLVPAKTQPRVRGPKRKRLRRPRKTRKVGA